MRSLSTTAVVAVTLLAAGSIGRACDLCPGARSLPFSYEARGAAMVVVGHITSARLAPDGVGGTSELTIDAIIKADPAFRNRKSITIRKYLPPDPKYKYFLVFLDAVKGRLDPYRGIPLTSTRMIDYLKNAPPWLDPKPDNAAVRAERLRYFHKFLGDPEPEISLDAYKEWALAANREVKLAAKGLSPQRLRQWLLDPKTPTYRLGLYAYLLGACGGERDADLLRGLIEQPTERMAGALDGYLAGYIALRPDEGWQLAKQIIADRKRPFTQRHALLRTLRFEYGSDPQGSRRHVLECLRIMLDQDDIQDLAVDQLRQWKVWDYTPQVLKAYATAVAPITKRHIIRYALQCPKPEAKRFIARLRKSDPALVADVEEALQFDLPPK